MEFWTEENPADLREWASWTDSTQVECCSCQQIPACNLWKGHKQRIIDQTISHSQCEIQRQQPRVFHPGNYCLKSQLDPELKGKNVEVNQEELTNSPWKCEKGSELKGSQGASPMFLLAPRCHQNFTSDLVAADLLKNKTQLSTFESLISSLRWFLNQTASHPAIRMAF